MKTKTPKPTASQVDCLDGLQDCLETLAALAGLLEASGRQDDRLEPSMVGHTGKLILAEVAKADEWLDKLEKAQ
jgi:hypothetical protein